MGKRLIITTLLAIIYDHAIFGRLITTPINGVQYVGSGNHTMNCSSTLGSNNISWYLVPVGGSTNDTIASGSIVYSAFTQLYWIEQPNSYASNLIIRTTINSTTGTFTCSDTEMVAHAQLILIYDVSTNYNASKSLIVGDVFRVSCHMTYLGTPSIIPIFSLYDQSPAFELIDNNTSPQLNISNSRIGATATFYRIVPCYMFLSMECYTHFGKPVGNLMPGSANNAPNYGIAFGGSGGNVSCVSITGATSGAMLYLGGRLTCIAIPNPPANYSWTDLTYGNSSIGPNFTVWHDGSFQCRASINRYGLLFSASKTVYNLTVEKLYSTGKPLYGPIAGGTKVTVTLNNWSKQVTNISAVYLGGILKITDIKTDRSSNSLVLITSNATTGLIRQPLPITIEFVPGPYNISTSLSFTYLDNPNITGISPTSFVVTGGTLVTANGTQLSSVANPLIQAAVVVERGVEKITTSETSFDSCEVNVEDDSIMICRMPKIKIPDDFLQVLDSQYHHINTRDTNSIEHIVADNPFLLSRRKRSLRLGALSVNGSNGVDRVVVYLGFILDGHRKYENINDALPETKLWFYSPPEINFTKEILEFDPDKDEFISIKGKHMTRGCRVADYLVQIGADFCENNNLQDNQLSCRPPKVQPQSTMNDTIHCDKHLSITITLGYQQYKYACLAYPDRTRQLALIIGLTVGLAGFVLLLTIFIVCIVRCRRGKSSKKQTDTQHKSGSQEIRNPEYANAAQMESRGDDVYVRQQYDNAIWPDE